jgi:hypothetical protein
MHDIPQSLVPGYILKSLYVLTLLLSPGLELFIENLISMSEQLLKNGDDNIEEMLHQENAIHAQISQRKSKIIEIFKKEEKSLYEDLTSPKY